MISWKTRLPPALRNPLRRFLVRVMETSNLRAGNDFSWLLRESYWRADLQALDEACARGSDEAAWRPLIERLPLEIFLLLLFTRQTEWPNIARRFPSLPAAGLQETYTSKVNQGHLATLAWFVPAVVQRYQAGGRRIEEATALDIGCGWGRFLRAFWRYIPGSQLYGMDISPDILKSCDECGVPGRRLLPGGLATPEMRRRFSLIYAYSVFTHLAEATHLELLARLREVVTDDGLVALTIRPRAFWDLLQVQWPQRAATWAELDKTHQSSGYGFTGHAGPTTYGEASIDRSYIERSWKDWQVEGFGFVPGEAYQIVVWLRPR
jgi:hypothetical protein